MPLTYYVLSLDCDLRGAYHPRMGISPSALPDSKAAPGVRSLIIPEGDLTSAARTPATPIPSVLLRLVEAAFRAGSVREASPKGGPDPAPRTLKVSKTFRVCLTSAFFEIPP